MNASKIITAFLELLKSNQSPLPDDALSDLPNLNKNLPETTDDIHKIADAIFDWCKKHQLIESLRSERGIEFPPSPNPAHQELDKTNIYEVYQELKQQVKTKSQKPQPKPPQP